MSRQNQHARLLRRQSQFMPARTRFTRFGGGRRLAVELLEERRPLTAQPFDLSPTPVALDGFVVETSLHERDWGSFSASIAEDAPAGVPPFPLGDTFKLHSNPGASKVIYLDFDGHVTTGTAWNAYWNIPTITTPAYSFEGGSDFSTNELERIQIVWERVVEDFLPFDVDVTTEDPGVEALRRSGGGDVEWGIRVVMGDDQANTGAGGIAWVGSFTWDTDTPTFVFNVSLVGVAEAASHEVGHTLGLRHDGGGGDGEYYQGHGVGATSWAPIMGVGYNTQLVQWSRGQYPGASNNEDDLSIITTQNGFGYRADDHSNSTAEATPLAGSSTTLEGEGIVERNTDKDYFVFTTGSGMTTINVAPFYRNPNLDVLATLYDSAGAVVATSNPVAALNATISVALARGTYYLSIDGTGKSASGSDYGYTDYGSLGYYSITGTRIDPDLAGVHGLKWNDRNGDGVKDADEPGLPDWTIFVDANGNGQLDDGERSTMTDANGSYSLDNLQPGAYLIAELQKPGWKQTFPTLPGTYSVTLAMGEQSFDNNFGNQAGSIRGQKWFDENSNGVKDEGERQLAGWTIFLDANANGELNDGEASTTTDANGNYAFLDLQPGTYTVAEVIRPDWLQTYPQAPGTHTVSLAIAQQVTGLDFGNAVGAIGGLVWNDRDGNGVQNDGEPALEGWTAYLDANFNGAFDNGPVTIAATGAPQTILDFTTTISELTVANLSSITDLDVTLNIPHTYASDLDVFLISPAGTRIELFTDVGSNGDNFFNTILDDEAATAITAGSAPFGGRFRPEGVLAGFDGQNPNGVWKLEITDDNIADAGTLLGWSLTITSAEQTTVTDALGRYEFLELAAGNYAVGLVAPSGWVQTSPATPGPQLVPVAAGQKVANINFGSRRAAILGQKWNDANGNGEKDAGELGLPAWVVYLDHNGNGVLDGGAKTTVAGNLPKPIPDLGILKSTLVVSGSKEIEDVNVTLTIAHTYLADLDVTLISPSGTRVELFSDIGGSGQNFTNTTLDDEALIPIASSPGLYSGAFQPEGLLADFRGEDPNGVWALEVIDDAGNDVGMLTTWSLSVTSNESSVATDANGNFAFYDLTPGAYLVRDVNQLNWTATYPVGPGGYALALVAGQQAPDANFGAKATILFGDYDRDNDVDGNDFLVWQRNLGTSSVPAGAGADGNFDAVVDGLDLAVWRSQFGEDETPALAAAFAASDDALLDDEPTLAVDAAFAQLDAASLAGPWAYRAASPAPRAALRAQVRPPAATATPAVRLAFAAFQLPLASSCETGDLAPSDSAQEVSEMPADLGEVLEPALS